MRTFTWVLLTGFLVFSACYDDKIIDPDAIVLLCSDVASADNEDADGDGYSPCDGDCDDQDPNANPGATEESETDGYDQDCDNFVFTTE